MNLFLLSVLCVAREFFDAVDSIRQLSLIFQCRFQCVLWLYFCWRVLFGRDAVFTNKFHASTMTLFSIMISLVNRELVFAVDSIRHPWLNFQRWFLVLQWLSFRWRFMHKHWHWVFDDSMRQTWICFCYRFYASLVNSFDAVDSIRQLSLIFQWRFQGVLWLYFCWRFLVGRDAVFTNDSMRQRWLCFL